MTAEAKRLQENQNRAAHWRRWGAYLSDRQWGTVAKIKVRLEPPGTIFPMTKRDRVPTAGAKMALPEFPITISACVLPLHFGMAKMQF